MESKRDEAADEGKKCWTALLEDDVRIAGQTAISGYKHYIAKKKTHPEQVLLPDGNDEQNSQESVIYSLILEEGGDVLVAQGLLTHAKCS